MARQLTQLEREIVEMLEEISRQAGVPPGMWREAAEDDTPIDQVLADIVRENDEALRALGGENGVDSP